MEGSENMVAVESTGTSNEIKEQYEKYEKFGRDTFLFLSSKRKNNGKRR